MGMNPFKELLELINAWAEASGSSISAQRGDSMWNDMDRAVRLLTEITDFIRSDPDLYTDENKTLVVQLWNIITQPRKDWNVASSQDSLDIAWSGLMKSLARDWDRTSVPVTVLTFEQVVTLRHTLQELSDLIGMIPEIPNNVKEYFQAEIIRCLEILDAPPVDSALVSPIITKINSFAFTAFTHSSKDTREKFGEKFFGIMRRLVPDIISGTAGQLAAGGIQALIGE